MKTQTKTAIIVFFPYLPSVLQSSWSLMLILEPSLIQVFPTIFISSSTVFISSLPLGHQAPTNLLQLARTWPNQPSSIHVYPTIFISSSTVLLQVLSCLPLLLFPGGVHLRYSCPCEEHGQATFSALPHLRCS